MHMREIMCVLGHVHAAGMAILDHHQITHGHCVLKTVLSQEDQCWVRESEELTGDFSTILPGSKYCSLPIYLFLIWPLLLQQYYQ